LSSKHAQLNETVGDD